jgi:hypothetical protein
LFRHGGAAVVPDPDMPPQPDRTTAAAASPSMLPVLLFAFMAGPFKENAAGGLRWWAGAGMSGMFNPAGKDGGGELVGQRVPGHSVRADNRREA